MATRRNAAPKPKPRPRSEAPTHKGQRTKQHLLRTALTLFESKGFEQTTLRHIAARARVSLGLLYRYYPSKDALVIELYDALSEEFEARASPLPAGSWSSRFLHALELSIEVLSPQREALRVMVPGLMVPPGHPLFIPGGQPSHARVEAKFIEAVSGASDAPRDAVRHGKTLYLVHLMVVLAWLLDRSPKQQATAQALKLGERWAPLAAQLMASPALVKLLEPFGEILELAVLGRRST